MPLMGRERAAGTIALLNVLSCQSRWAAAVSSQPPPPMSSASSPRPDGGPTPGTGAGAGAGVAAGSSNAKLKRAMLLFAKGLFIWTPAILFWGALALGAPMLDFRTDEEVSEDENEVRRLERFFDVEDLPEAEYLVEWQAKEEALSQIVDKLLRSQRFMDCLMPGAFSDSGTAEDGPRKGEAASADVSQADGVEVSYILPPPGAAGDAVSTVSTATGQRPWSPRLIVAHREGSLAMVSASFEHVARGKDRDERWACTSLRSDLIAFCDGELACESICDLRGPPPHGVRYVRI